MTSARPLPTLVFLHFLGGSAGTWKPIEDRLQDRYRCLRLDLPGFGDEAERDGYSVSNMADRIAERVAACEPGPWLLVGHSMGAKVALLAARRAEDGDASLAGLSGLVLAAGSPASPEPMAESMRDEMLGWFDGGAEQNHRQATDYIAGNVSASLPGPLHDGAVSDVLRTSRAAWTAWLERGSREDLVQTVGVLRMPALILAGRDDKALGEDAQRALMAPHFASATIVVIDHAAHLLPMEQPDRVAALIEQFAIWAGEPMRDDSRAASPLLESVRITTRTRTVLAARRDDPAYAPSVLGAPRLAILRAVLDRLLPRPDDLPIDLAARLDAMLADGTGDGWRHADMPVDMQAAIMALDTLEASAQAGFDRPFVCLEPGLQDRLLDRVEDGALGFDLPGRLTGVQMALWLEELRGDAARLFMADPRTISRLGISAVATGGDAALAGFESIGPGTADPWEAALFGAAS